MADIPNRGPQLIAVVAVLLVFSLTATILRCYVRISLVKAFGVDDYLMVFAMMTFIAFCSVCLTGVHYGTGRHYWDLAEHDIQEALMYWYFCYIWYCVTMVLTKISIGYFLLRITVERIHNWIILVVMSLSVITGICFLFITTFQCHPISFFWNKNQDGSCINIDVIIAFTYLYSAFSVICDFTFALLPIVLIMQLQMNSKTKIALIPVMLMACVASVAVVVRFPYVKDFKTVDFLWATIDIAIWSTVEQGLAITAGSLATIRPLFRKIAAKLGWSTMGSNLPPTGDGASMGNHQTTGRSRKNKSRDPFSLATFNRNEEEDEEGNGQLKLVEGYPGNFQTTITTITADPKSVWGSKRHKGDNESEEELRMEGSKVRSFLITEETV
ncbi:hypothetical protein ACSS6W_000105 [Trichoderma asperelloides]|uniref:Satratoxin biosynthesis SC1 cluster protein 4 n=1 Tax=Trichoderma asperellum TaxID=101201 RepID=A0A6V8R5I1_TRIAP|nr:hypothetical protein LI328DRAFT_53460 [Trichoderma asperelloides]GFP60294.1 satratoxin biosynthesis SC1 cluster protein 4 [Trichoderma asperellum]